MTDICFYFQVHQPFRLRKDFSLFSVGKAQGFEDEKSNCEILKKVARRCYLPTNAVMLDLIRRHEGRFRISYSISGVALEQFALYEPSVIDSFRALAETGCVEFLGETYYHSLAFLFSEDEFKAQVSEHAKALKKHFGVTPTSFRNTELIYSNRVAQTVEKMGYKAVLAEGADRVLSWQSPGFVYAPAGTEKISLLLKHYQLSDDIAFRFSNRAWEQWPLTTEKYVDWLGQRTDDKQGPLVNLFMDYETFGEHQWEETGIFEFLRHLPAEALRRSQKFVTPSEAVALYPRVAALDVPDYVSWADSERDLTAWVGNHMQNAATTAIYQMEKEVKGSGDPAILHAWRKLQTSDHFYYMCTKFFQDGDVHKYFNPYDSPYDAFIYFSNALTELRWRLTTRRASKAS